MNLRRSIPALMLLLIACETPPPNPPPSAPQPSASAAPSASVATASPIASASASPSAVASAAPAPPAPTALALPGVTGPVSADFIAFESGKNRVWIPLNTGAVDVFDIGANTFARLDGFKTVEKEGKGGQKRMAGPSSVFVGATTAYVVNRATNEICPVATATLEASACFAVGKSTDLVAYVAKVKEAWATTPGDHAIVVLDAQKPALKAKTVIKMDGEPEGYAVDEDHGIFYTNLEDKDRTLAIDVKTHAIKTNVATGCGGDGPRGLAVDGARGLVMVACTDGVRVLDAAHGLAPLAKADTGGGVDNVDYDPKTKNLMVASGKLAQITVLRVDDKGQLTVVGTGATAPSARNAVADPNGNGYLVDGKNGKLLVVKISPP